MNRGQATTARVLLETMREAEVRYLFANLGSDHTAITEAYARSAQDGGTGRLPELVLCPHEGVALSAAHGYAQVSGQPQAVLVHTDCGTQNLGGAVHNAARGRVPVLILAGLSPMTGQGELPGSRNEFIQWIQDNADQAGIVRGYVKYAHEIRTGRNAREIVRRALQIACSEPAGPVYLTATREVLEQDVPAQPEAGEWWTPVAPAALAGARAAPTPPPCQRQGGCQLPFPVLSGRSGGAGPPWSASSSQPGSSRYGPATGQSRSDHRR
jgi:acetolactate synthase I/II/III large subunit